MTDRKTILVVTIALAFAVLGGMAGVVFLTAVNRVVPDVLANITTTALGALGALLVSTRVDPGQLPAEKPSVADTAPTWVEKRMETDDRPATRKAAAKS